jgi:hypothetical protein
VPAVVSLKAPPSWILLYKCVHCTHIPRLPTLSPYLSAILSLLFKFQNLPHLVIFFQEQPRWYESSSSTASKWCIDLRLWSVWRRVLVGRRRAFPWVTWRSCTRSTRTGCWAASSPSLHPSWSSMPTR